MNDELTKMHTEELINLAIQVNAELQARLRGTMFALSAYEQGKFPTTADQTVKMVLEQLRGEK